MKLTEKAFLSIGEASELGFGAEKTIRNYIDTEQLKAYKVGGAVRIKPEDLFAMAKPIKKRRAKVEVGDDNEL